MKIMFWIVCIVLMILFVISNFKFDKELEKKRKKWSDKMIQKDTARLYKDTKTQLNKLKHNVKNKKKI